MTYRPLPLDDTTRSPRTGSLADLIDEQCFPWTLTYSCALSVLNDAGRTLLLHEIEDPFSLIMFEDERNRLVVTANRHLPIVENILQGLRDLRRIKAQDIEQEPIDYLSQALSRQVETIVSQIQLSITSHLADPSRIIDHRDPSIYIRGHRCYQLVQQRHPFRRVLRGYRPIVVGAFKKIEFSARRCQEFHRSAILARRVLIESGFANVGPLVSGHPRNESISDVPGAHRTGRG